MQRGSQSTRIRARKTVKLLTTGDVKLQNAPPKVSDFRRVFYLHHCALKNFSKGDVRHKVVKAGPFEKAYKGLSFSLKVSV